MTDSMNKLNCSVARDLMPQAAEGLLAPESEAALQAHLETCEACRELYAEMTAAEPASDAETAEIDYLKKVKKSRRALILGAAAAVLALAVGLGVFFRWQAKQADVSYDEASGTIVVYGRSDDTEIKLPDETDEAKYLDAQYASFHVTAKLSVLRTQDIPLDEYLSGYLDRTNRSLRFLREYLREHCADAYPAERADKYVEMTISGEENYTFSETEDRISLEIGSYYWHREELYVLSLLGDPDVEWKQLGYAWYLGACLDPYGESLATTDFSLIGQQKYGDTYVRGGGTNDATPENYRRLTDAVSYVCLTDGMDWGAAYESKALKKTALYTGPKKTLDPGNDMSVIMAASFIAWLSDTYGFGSVSDFCFGRAAFEEAFGTDFAAAYQSWSGYILQTYGGQE